MAYPSPKKGRPLVASGLLGMALFLGGCQTVLNASPSAPQAAIESVPGQVIVKFRAGTPSADRTALRDRYGATGFDGLLPDTERWHVTSEVDSLRSRLIAEPSLEWAEPNYRREILAYAASERGDTSVNQWYLSKDRGIGIDDAWNAMAGTGTPGTGVMVAVVDTGVDINHPDLQDRIARDDNGVKRFIDEVGHDTSFSTGTTDYMGMDGNGHGTHVAGLVGATGNNGHLVGVAPGVTILPVKVMRADGGGEDFSIAKGLKDAADNGADVINLSVGGPAPSQLLADAIAYDLNKGSTVVIASGNGYGPVFYPAAYAGVICVGATSGAPTAPYTIPSYSNRGPELSLVSPGGDGTHSSADRGIYSTVPTYPTYMSASGIGPSYGILSGTSMATPIVSGVAALVIADAKARGLTLTPSQVRSRLLATARPLGSQTFSSDWGYGLVDPLKAITWNGPGGTR
ncbi:MAG TPA: S8 family serine peptidase [Stenomitos sp.]